MTSTENLKERIIELEERARGFSDEKTMGFSELRDVVVRAQESGKTSLIHGADGLLEDVSPEQVKGATVSDYVELMRETDFLATELETLMADHVVESGGDELGNFLQAVEENSDMNFRGSLSYVTLKKATSLARHADTLLKSEDEALEDALRYVAVEYPEAMKHATSEFFERFEEGEHRALFCNYLAGLCRADPEYAEEWVRKTIEELDQKDYEEDGSADEETGTRRKVNTVEDCVRVTARWCPGAIVEAKKEEMSRRTRRVFSSEVSRQSGRNKPEGGVKRSVDFRLQPKEYKNVRQVVSENDDSFSEAVEEGLRMYVDKKRDV